MCPQEKAGSSPQDVITSEVRIKPSGLPGTMTIPQNASALVLFAHGSGSSRFSTRNQTVARALNEHGVATLLFDLLTSGEEADRSNVFNIPLLADRLLEAVRWLQQQEKTRHLRLGLFGASTGAAAALVAAAALQGQIGAIVSRGGRPDLAEARLKEITTPTLLIVGGADDIVIELNEMAFERLPGPKALEIVPGATHLFPEPGALEMVIKHAIAWFDRYLNKESPTDSRTDDGS